MTAWGLGRVKTPLEERVMGRDFGWVAAFCQFAEFGEFSIGSGFVASLARPGGNVTGSTLVESSIAGKWLEVLKEIAPRVNRVAFLFNPAAAPYAEYYLVVFKAAAPSLGMEAIAAPINKTSEIEPVIAEQARDQNGVLILMPDTFLLAHRAEVTWLAGRYALPAVYPYEPGHKRCRIAGSCSRPSSPSQGQHRCGTLLGPWRDPERRREGFMRVWLLVTSIALVAWPRAGRAQRAT
jgi:hypothetical protein